MPDLNQKSTRQTFTAASKNKQENLSLFKRFTQTAAQAGLDWFLLALAGLVGLAYVYPGLGKDDGLLPLNTITTYGVSAIFFFYGLRLSPAKLKAGLHNWHLHLLIQGVTFLLFPVLVLAAQTFSDPAKQQNLWPGIFYLAALPSTVSSSVVMVSIAGGNMPAAIFNASISSLLGVFVTPLWMGWYLQASTGGLDFGPVIGKLMVQVLLPVVAGILLHTRLGKLAERHRQKLRIFDQIIILLIVFNSFSESFARRLFLGLTSADLLLLGISMVFFFLSVMGIIYLLGRLLQLNRPDNITALFCGSKKSLVHGTVMSRVLFPDAALAGLVLLPIMLYHALQLILASIIAQAMARRTVPPAKTV